MRAIVVFSYLERLFTSKISRLLHWINFCLIAKYEKNEETKSRHITNIRMLRLCSFCLCTKLFHIISVEWKLTRFYCGGLLCKPQPWKHFMNLLDSLPLAVKNNLRGFSGCFTRKCWIYTWEKSEILPSFTSWLEINLLCYRIFMTIFLYESLTIEFVYFTWADL